jgi:CCR4-NOT transcription complex subunit 3
MEKFKVCEKEMKTKAYSNIALQQPLPPTDEGPNDRTKRWIRNSLERLKSQIDTMESKIESVQAKKGKKDQEQIEKLRYTVMRHRFHEGNLETILRKLDNETVTADQVRFL